MFSQHTFCNRMPHPVCSLKVRSPDCTGSLSPCVLRISGEGKTESLVAMKFGLSVAFLLLLGTVAVTVKGKITFGWRYQFHIDISLPINQYVVFNSPEVNS